jgi:polysaccharide biosynthesis protein PslG
LNVLNPISRRWSRLALVSTCVVLVAALLGCGRVTAQSNKISGYRAGFSGGGHILWESDAELNRDFDSMKATGAKWVRIDVDWKSIQSGGPGSWNWSYQDRIFGAAVKRGLSVLAVPTYSPPWARSGYCTGSMYCPPRNPNEFATFVRAAVSRYAPLGVHSWEIWNEPNWDPWWIGAPNAPQYVAVLKAAYVAVHQADRNGRVITGGLAPHGDLSATPNDPRSPVNYLKAMYAAGARGYFDAFGVHPYPPLPNDPLSGKIGWNALLQTTLEHQIMASYGDGGKQIWGTEYGAPTGSSDPKRVSTAQQASYINTGLRWWVGQSFTGPLMIDTVRDTPVYGAASPDNWMGVLYQNFAPKPAYYTMSGMLAH